MESVTGYRGKDYGHQRDRGKSGMESVTGYRGKDYGHRRDYDRGNVVWNM